MTYNITNIQNTIQSNLGRDLKEPELNKIKRNMDRNVALFIQDETMRLSDITQAEKMLKKSETKTKENKSRDKRDKQDPSIKNESFLQRVFNFLRQ